MQTKLSTILERKGAKVHSVTPEQTVLEAVRSMNQERIGAVLVLSQDRVVGIFTERDVLCRVVDAGCCVHLRNLYATCTSRVNSACLLV